MEHFMPNEFCTNFIGLVRSCFENNVKLLNVPYRLLAQHDEFCFAFGQQVNGLFVSLRNLPWFVANIEMQNLEMVVIEKISETEWRTMREGEAQGMVAQWPVLKCLDLNIDSAQFQGENEEIEEPFLFGIPRERKTVTQDVLDFLFYPKPGKIFDELRDLAVRFPVGVGANGENLVPVPNVSFITDTCRFVTKLTLGNWQGTEEQVWGFWEGLPHLENVVLEECEKIGDRAFLGKDGDDDGNPKFLKLRNLKKLSFKRFDKMPRITDKLFKFVLRNLKMKQFYLTSSTPVKSVTVSGIEALITGQFNSSVEKFPFEGWSLDGVTEEALMELKLKFRASHMH